MTSAEEEDEMANDARRQRTARPAVLALATACVIGLTLLASACGGSSGKKVAQVGSTQTSTSAVSSRSAKLAAAVAYSACMRRHGVPQYPDPNASRDIHIGIPKNSPQFKAAERTCRKLLPNGGEPSPQEQAQHLQEALAYAVCMRGHGVPTFPDPTKGPDGGPVWGGIGPSTGVNLNSPQFKAAQRACHKLLAGSPSGAG
jgi:hypothetical protein